MKPVSLVLAMYVQSFQDIFIDSSTFQVIFILIYSICFRVIASLSIESEGSFVFEYEFCSFMDETLV